MDYKFNIINHTKYVIPIYQSCGRRWHPGIASCETLVLSYFSSHEVASVVRFSVHFVHQAQERTGSTTESSPTTPIWNQALFLLYQKKSQGKGSLSPSLPFVPWFAPCCLQWQHQTLSHPSLSSVCQKSRERNCLRNLHLQDSTQRSWRSWNLRFQVENFAVSPPFEHSLSQHQPQHGWCQHWDQT